MVDCIMIDTDYNGEVFNIIQSDVLEKKNDLVTGEYELLLPEAEKSVIAVLITKEV